MNEVNNNQNGKQKDPTEIDWTLVKSWVKQFFLSWVQLVSIPLTAYFIYEWVHRDPTLMQSTLRFVGIVLFTWFFFSCIAYYVRYRLKIRRLIKEMQKAQKAAQEQTGPEAERVLPKEED